MKNQFVDRELFFEDVMGIKEKDFFNLPPQSRAAYFHKENGKNFVGEEGRKFMCGTFELLKAGDLIKKSEEILSKNEIGGGTFTVLEGIDTLQDRDTYKIMDIGAMQANEKFRNCLFDVASNFNALETTSPNEVVTSKFSLLQNYVGDRTQGPYASISAAPGLIYRRYFLNESKFPNDVSKWEHKPIQKEYKNQYVNLLEDLTGEEEGKLRMSRGGYVQIKEGTTPTEEDYSNIRIAYHSNIQVSHGSVQGWTHKRVANNDRQQPQIIDQCFSAAIDLGMSSGGLNMGFYTRQGKWPSFCVNWAKTILNASREGILRAAFLKGKKTVVLTLVGCGVFRNEHSWVAESMERMKDFIIRSGLNVILVWFVSFGKEKNFRKQLLNIVKSTGGKYKQYYEGEESLLN